MIIFLIVLWILLATAFVIAVFREREMQDLWEKILDRIDGKVFARRARRKHLKEKYGFDDSYDKYIA